MLANSDTVHICRVCWDAIQKGQKFYRRKTELKTKDDVDRLMIDIRNGNPKHGDVFCIDCGKVYLLENEREECVA